MSALMESIKALSRKTSSLVGILTVQTLVLTLSFAFADPYNKIWCNFYTRSTFSDDDRNLPRDRSFYIHWMPMTLAAFIITLIAGHGGLLAWVIARRVSNMVFKSLSIVFLALLSLGSAFSLISLLVESGRTDAMWRIADDFCSLSDNNYRCYCHDTDNASFIVLSVFTPIVLLTSAATARAMRLDLEDEGEPSTVTDILRYSLTCVSSLWRYGHAGVVSTRDFVSQRILFRETIVRARMQGDSHWREISIPAESRTFATLCDLLREPFHLSNGAELSIVKNDDILVERDSDVLRLRMGDKLEVAVIGAGVNQSDSASVALLSGSKRESVENVF